MSSGVKTVGHGELSATSYKFEWKIYQFLSYNGRDLNYRSPVFRVSKSSWFLEIYPNGHTDQDSIGYISLFLYRSLTEDSEAVNFSLGIVAVDNIIENEMKTSYQDPGMGWDKFIKKSELLQRRSELVPSGILTIICQIEEKDAVPDFLAERYDLAEDFKNLFFSEECTDVTLKVKEKKFSAHKAVLVARSPVFAAMFKNEMSEKKTGFVNISDCDMEAFNVFLLFLYSGDLDLKKCNVCYLYKISDKYDVSKLKLICVDFMIQNLSVENIFEILILGDQFSESQLLVEVQWFFNKKFEEIVSSKNWESFLKNNFRLANGLLKAMAPKIKVVE